MPASLAALCARAMVANGPSVREAFGAGRLPDHESLPFVATYSRKVLLPFAVRIAPSACGRPGRIKIPASASSPIRPTDTIAAISLFALRQLGRSAAQMEGSTRRPQLPCTMYVDYRGHN